MILSIKISGVDDLMKTLDPKLVQLATRQAINRAAQSGKSIASEEIRKVYNLKASDLSPWLKVYQAKMSDMEAKLEITGKPMSLSYFGARQVTGSRVITRKGAALISKSNKSLKARGPVPIGVTEQVKRGTPAFLQKAFMAKMKSGHIGVFVRKGKGIMEKNVITIPSMVQNAEVMPAVLKRIQDRLLIEVPRQIDYYMGRGSK